MHRFGLVSFIAVVGALLWASALGAQPTSSDERDDEVTQRREADAKSEGALSKIKLRPPTGWMVGRAPKGSVGLFRSIGEDKGQIEVKATAGLDARQAKVFFKSFDVNLQRVGAKRLYAPKAETIGKVEGKLTEYKVTSSERPYRLVLFHVHRGRVAWLVAGFFEERLRGPHLKAMRQLIKTVPFDVAP